VPLFGVFPSTAQLYLVDGGPPAVGSLHRNPDLAATYRLIAEQGIEAFYAGPIGEDLVAAVQQPVAVADLEFPMVGQNMTMDDLAAYRALVRPATRMTYRGHDVYGMGPPSSGGLTVGLALGILQHFGLAGLPEDELLHLYLEATRVAFADRGAFMADADFVDVPVTGLQAPGFAAQRAELVGARRSNAVAPGDPFAFQAEGEAPPLAPASSTSEGENTTHMTVADQWDNVVAYTITIEAPGGNGMVVPGRGFLLNNELTDFDPFPGTVNSVQPGMRPRSSMSPTLVLKDGRPLMALGSPGGSTIISTVLQTLVNVLDLGMSAEEAVEAPRASYLGIPEVLFERSFARSVVSQLADLGHQMVPVPELGFVTMIVFNEDGSMTAVAEAQRGGGGSARVVRED